MQVFGSLGCVSARFGEREALQQTPIFDGVISPEKMQEYTKQFGGDVYGVLVTKIDNRVCGNVTVRFFRITKERTCQALSLLELYFTVHGKEIDFQVI